MSEGGNGRLRLDFDEGGGLITSSSLPGYRSMKILDSDAESSYGGPKMTLKDITDLQPGDHLCCIYQTEEEHRSLITPYIKLGLEGRDKVIYIVDAHTAEELLGYLEDEGLESESYLNSGQLAIFSVDEAYMKGGAFDPDGMIELLRSETEKALSEGYNSLRVTGEMSWALKGFPGSEKIIEYEAKLNRFFPGSRCMAICQYDRRRFGAEVLLDVLTTHPMAVIGTEIYDNFYYIPPDLFLDEGVAVAMLDRWCDNLAARRESEQALRESEERFRAIVENAPFGYYRLGKEMVWEYVNPVWERMHGLSSEEVVGKNIESTQPAEEVEQTTELVERALAGESVTGEFGHVCAGGDIRYHLFNMQPLRRGGEVVAVEGFITDITDHKRADLALVESERRYRKLADTLPQVVFEADGSGRITYVNEVTHAIFGYKDEDIEEGLYALDVFAPSDRERIAAAINKMFDGSSTGATREYLARRKDGSVFPCVVYSTLITDEAGKPAGIRGILTDISERKSMEADLKRINRELEVYAEVVSHDLRGPISVIKSASDTLNGLIRRCEDPETAAAGRKVADIIAKSSSSASALVENLLALAKTGQVPQKVSEIYVREIVERILREKVIPLREKGVSVKVCEDLGRLRADPTHLYQIFSNLIGNAIAYCDNPTPEILIEHRVGDSVHVYKVRDNGRGIAKSDLEEIFLPLRKGKGGGTGIGLSIVAKLVSLYGGQIRAYNDGGACFEFSLKDP